MSDWLHIRNLSVTRGQKKILHQIQASLPARALTMLMGENGAGKSTLLLTLSGEIKPEPHANSGFWVDGSNFLEHAAVKQAQSRALLRQHHSLTLDFYAHEVIRLSLDAHCPRQQQDDLVQRMARLTHTEHLLDRLYPSLSGGEQARIHLARVFGQLWRDEEQATRILLLDEPVASLDPYHQHHVCQMIHEFIRLQNVTVLMTVHDLHLAARYADYIVLLHQSELIAQGSAREVMTAQNLHHAFNLHTHIRHDENGRPVIAPELVSIGA